MKAKEVEDLWQWMEKSWEAWMSEWDSVVRLVDKELVTEAAEHSMVEMEKKWLKVSVSFLYFHIQC